jgi:hypothetical protein
MKDAEASSVELEKHLLLPKIIWGAMFVNLGVYYVILQTIVNAGSGENPEAQRLLFPLAIISVMSLSAAFYIPLQLGRFGVKVQSLNPLQKYFVPFIVRMALNETVAIYGVVLSFMSRDTHYYLYFAVPSSLVFLMSFPTLDTLKKIVGEQPAQA